MKLEVNFDLGGPDTNFKLTREKYCESIEKEYEKFLESPNSSRNGFFVYSLLIGFLITLILGVFVSCMQNKTIAALQESIPLKNEDPSPLLPPIEPSNFPPNQGFSVYDGGMTSDAESRVTDWIQQQYMKTNVLAKSDESANDTRSPEEIAKDLEIESSRLKLGSLLQEGTFGKVYQGRFSSGKNNEEDDVIIKTVMSWSSSTQSQLLGMI